VTTNDTTQPETSTETNAGSNPPPLSRTEKKLFALLERREQGTATPEDEDRICAEAINLFIDRLFGKSAADMRANLLELPAAVEELQPLLYGRLTNKELKAFKTTLLGLHNLDTCLHTIFRAITESWTVDQQRTILDRRTTDPVDNLTQGDIQ